MRGVSLNKKRMIKILVFLSVIAVIYFITWGINWYQFYRNVDIEYEQLRDKTFIKCNDNNTFTIKCPDLFSFTGNYAISDDNVAIIIWTRPFSKVKEAIGVEISDESGFKIYRFYIDNEINYDEKNSTKFSIEETNAIETLLNQHRETVIHMIDKCVEEWKIEI